MKKITKTFHALVASFIFFAIASSASAPAVASGYGQQYVRGGYADADCTISQRRSNRPLNGGGQIMPGSWIGAAVGGFAGDITARGKSHKIRDTNRLLGAVVGGLVGGAMERRNNNNRVYTDWEENCGSRYSRPISVR